MYVWQNLYTLHEKTFERARARVRVTELPSYQQTELHIPQTDPKNDMAKTLGPGSTA